MTNFHKPQQSHKTEKQNHDGQQEMQRGFHLSRRSLEKQAVQDQGIIISQKISKQVAAAESNEFEKTLQKSQTNQGNQSHRIFVQAQQQINKLQQQEANHLRGLIKSNRPIAQKLEND